MSWLQPTANELIHPRATSAMGELYWFAVQTRPRHEKRASAELREKGISTLLPLSSETRQWSDRQRIVELPVFPQYLFVRIEPRLDKRLSVLRTNGITNFVGQRGMGTAIPDEQIERIQTVLVEVPMRSHAYTNVGNRVRIKGGALEGIEGILTAVNGDRTLVVSVELIQRSLAIRLTGFDVEPV
jgi:transcription termination/antitermination protein NusG